MAAQDRYSGKDMWVAWENSGGMPILSSSGRNFERSASVGDIDATAYGDGYTYYIPGMGEATASMEMLDESGTSMTTFNLAEGTEGTIHWAPRGSTSSYPYHSQEAVITAANVTYPYDGVVVINVEWRLRGTLLNAGWAGTID